MSLKVGLSNNGIVTIIWIIFYGYIFIIIIDDYCIIISVVTYIVHVSKITMEFNLKTKLVEEIVKYLEYTNQFSMLYQSIQDFKNRPRPNNLELRYEELPVLPTFVITADLSLLADIGSKFLKRLLQ